MTCRPVVSAATPSNFRGLHAQIGGRPGPGKVDDVAIAHVLPDVHEPGRLGIRQRPQQHGVDDAEDGGRRADAQCQRPDCRNRKSWLLRNVRTA
jgi:hypothetical protein